VKAGAALAALAVGLALALAGCFGSGEGRPVPDPVLRRVVRRLPALRGLHFKRVPELRVVSRAEFRRIERRRAAAAVRRLSASGRARAARLRAEARIAQQLPVLLGLLEHLPRQTAADEATKVAAIYVGVEDSVYLISDGAPGRRHSESLLSHELTHALDQQNLGSRKPQLSSPFSDASDARFAVQEGSAVLVQYRYARRYLGDREPIADKLRETGQEVGSRLDHYIEDGADFSYRRGARFVRALYRRGGVALVNRALRHPPVTTASIFTPSRWPAHDRALPLAGHVQPGPRWARSYSGTFGAASTHQLLADSGPVATRLARDWRGGSVELWQRPLAVAQGAKPTPATCVTVVRWRWRAPIDTEIVRVLVDSQMHGGVFHAHQAGANSIWHWRGGGAALVSSGTTTTLVLAPTLATAAATAAGA
jgi:hypothetical protein